MRPGDPPADGVLEVIRVLRDHVTMDELRSRFERGAAEGYRLIGLRDGDRWTAATGFRIHTNTNNGRILFVDDLVTISEGRSTGYGRALNEHLVELARSEGCVQIELDSGVQRFDAHRFYLRERYAITAHHFTRRLR